MGYACPVCGTPQADATHLANHVAFTALVRGGEHEAWLDEHCPGWERDGEDDLAERVVEYAREEPFPDPDDARASDRRPETETTADDHRPRTDADGRRDRHRGHGHDHDHDHGRGDVESDPDGRGPPTGGRVDDDGTDPVLERARELTRRRRANRDAAMGDPGGGDGEATGGERDDDDGEDESESGGATGE